MRYLHSMVRVSNLEESLTFFEMLGLSVVRRSDSEKGRFTNVHLAAMDDVDLAKAVRAPTLELTYNWDPEDYRGAQFRPPRVRGRRHLRDVPNVDG
jgi:lactoylglutathione lyase